MWQITMIEALHKQLWVGNIHYHFKFCLLVRDVNNAYIVKFWKHHQFWGILNVTSLQEVQSCTKGFNILPLWRIILQPKCMNMATFSQSRWLIQKLFRCIINLTCVASLKKQILNHWQQEIMPTLCIFGTSTSTRHQLLCWYCGLDLDIYTFTIL